jgi:redox-sensitive bicupin YhaK (pirin superfamily)
MTAGRGIAHSERFEDPAAIAGGELEMIQTWVALPEKNEEDNPSFNNYTADQLPVFTERGVWMRLIAGNAFGLRNKVQTHSPLFYLHAVLQKGAKFGLPKEHTERGIYIAKGSIELAQQTYTAGQMLVFNKGTDPLLIAKEHTTLMLLGGDPVGERYIWWNFVHSRKERIEQAKKTGSMDELYCLRMTIKNLYPCLKTVLNLQEDRSRSRFRESWSGDQR